MKKYQEARHEYEADLKKHPNKFNDIYGAGLASARVGDRAKAAKYYEQLLILCDSSKSDRLQLRAARDYLSLAKK
jgi:tetratricopeptide (TPR) repeat protein